MDTLLRFLAIFKSTTNERKESKGSWSFDGLQWACGGRAMFGLTRELSYQACIRKVEVGRLNGEDGGHCD